MEFIADSFLVTAALGAVEALVSRAAQQMTLEWGFHGDLKKLHDNLTTIQGLLCKARDPSSERIKKWLKDLRSGISHAEKVLDELEYEAARRKIEVRNRMGNKVRDFFSLSNPWAFHHRVVPKLERINIQLKSLDQICRRDNSIYIGPSDTPMSNNEKFRRTTPEIDESRVAGRDGDVLTVRDMLIESSEDDLSVVAIVGTAGLGKTTLAQLIWKDESVQGYFEPRMWICVSGDLKVERLLNEMIEKLTAQRSEIPNIEGVKSKLQKELRGKRYLLVIDDVFSCSPEDWAKLMFHSLKPICGTGGSKILVTTRFIGVAQNIEGPLTHELGKLSDGDSWTLFRKIAFADGGPRETQFLVEIGKKLVEKCKGVPFVIKSLASLLSSKHDESEWMSMCYNEAWSSVRIDPALLEGFRLTFDQLPSPALKQCFAYCAVFPKGRDIKKDELIQLWMSLGYLHSTSAMGDTGDRYYNTLVEKSLLENGDMDDYKNITSCKMPDHLHDLAVHLYEGYRQTLEPSQRKYHTVVEHLSSDFWRKKKWTFQKEM